MRKFILFRGPPGAGKTTLINNVGLGEFALSADAVRKAVRAPMMNHRGELTIDQENAHHIWEIVRQSFNLRIESGQTIALDSTSVLDTDYEYFIEKAHEAGYEIIMVDMFDVDRKIIDERNQSRTAYDFVPAKTIDKMINLYKPHDRSDARISKHFSTAEAHAQLGNYLRAYREDLNDYKNIIHIGDLQGVFEAAFTQDSPLTKKLDPENYYVFVGDALDRGVENGKLLRWILDEVTPNIGKNVTWIKGNHEKHLEAWGKNSDIKSLEFRARTLPQIEEEGIRREDVLPFISAMSPYLWYEYGNEQVIVSHAGLPSALTPFEKISENVMVNGVGGFGLDIDEKFTQWATTEPRDEFNFMLSDEQPLAWRQVHGHRNRKMLGITSEDVSLNLEGQAEFGGQIRMAVLNKKGWTVHQIRNTLYRSPKEWRDIGQAEKRKPFSKTMPIPAWIERGDNETTISQSLYDEFMGNDHVNVRAQQKLPHIDTIAFAKSAYYGKIWDGITNKARGLFVDRESLEVVARSYTKFFNLGERPETQLDVVKGWEYPIRISIKENGYLGLVGWDARTQQIVFSSKGSMDNDFAAEFERIARDTLGEAGIERMTRAVRDLKGTAIFEVNAPKFDPHIIEYENDHIVMLDFVRRSEQFEKLDYENLKKLGAYIEVTVRNGEARAPNEKALVSIIEKTRNESGRWNQQKIEGLVLEDATGRIVKVKSHYYDMWKHARGLVERMALQRRKNQEVKLDVPEHLTDFIAWVQKQDHSITDQPIIALRNRYLERPEDIIEADNEALLAKKVAREKAEAEERDISGFMRGYEAILKQVRAGTAKTHTVTSLINRSNELPHVKAAFDSRDDHKEFYAYVAQDKN